VTLGYCDLRFAKVDIQRQRRRGYPEVIYCPGKTDFQIKEIAKEILAARQPLVLTKIKKETFAYLKRIYPKLEFDPEASIAYLKNKRAKAKKGCCLVITAGTADIPVAEEAAAILEIMDNQVKRLYDVGVAGVHRLFDKQKILKKAKIIIVVAGMEGALASIVSGLVSCPVIAVPTSCGYGANFKGLSALLTMLNSCSPGVAVVNIDNGFGAGYFASLVNK
jgi:NCAIR mutase (PurE)-related protein